MDMTKVFEESESDKARWLVRTVIAIGGYFVLLFRTPLPGTAGKDCVKQAMDSAEDMTGKLMS